MKDETNEPEPGEDSVRISMLVEKELLSGIDSASGRFGLTRSAFIRQALLKALREIGKEPDWNDIIESTKNPFYYDLPGLAKRIRHVGYISPEALRLIRKKIHDQVGPAEIIQGLRSPYEQLLRKIGLTRRQVEEALSKGDSISLRNDGE